MPNALCIVCGTADFELPLSMGTRLISATPASIAIGCRPDCDAPTEFVIGALSEVAELRPPAFTGTLSTPERIVSILNVNGECIVSQPADGELTDVSIWADDETEPDRIVVGLR